jgi:hypothetical protein
MFRLTTSLVPPNRFVTSDKRLDFAAFEQSTRFELAYADIKLESSAEQEEEIGFYSSIKPTNRTQFPGPGHYTKAYWQLGDRLIINIHVIGRALR